MDQYGVGGWIPQTYLVDQEGMPVGKIIGHQGIVTCPPKIDPGDELE